MAKNQIESFDLSTKGILKESILQIAEGMTGIAASERKELKLSIGHILQRALAGRFLSTLQKEWQQFKEKGRIKDDYEQTEQHRACLKELLEYLERGVPEERILEILKRIFLIAATEKHSERNDFLPHQYMKIASELTPGGILLMESAYSFAKSIDKNTGTIEGENWIKKVAESSSLEHEDLIRYYLDGLCKKHLTSTRLLEAHTRSITVPPPYYGLTKLGYSFCDYINHYKGEETNENLADHA